MLRPDRPRGPDGPRARPGEGQARPGKPTWRIVRYADDFYTFIAKRPIQDLKAKIRALTHRTSQHDLRSLLIRHNQITRGWTAYFRHAVAKSRFGTLAHFLWWRLIRTLSTRHRWNWTDVRREHTALSGRWLPITAGGIELFDMGKVPVTRYRWRATRIPNRWTEGAA
ncbi:group II intron maturase-specific domain-containing protein [Kitasatospora sp. NPDC094019]|uniref:group II intron maturase-specific domain-containing protein n=1 Tax=Kitasatospora sp. NPDC094019 TaxID=3364091 RepID=UPI003821C0FF